MTVYIIPVLLFALFVYAIIKKVNLYTCFTNGCKNSLKLVFNIFPYIASIMIAIALFRVSGLSDALVDFISPLFESLGIPKQVSELVLLRPFTGSGSISMLEDIISSYGADSYIARCAACIVGSSETVFYVSAIYFASSKVKNITPAIVIALIGNIVGAIVSCLLCLVM